MKKDFDGSDMSLKSLLKEILEVEQLCSEHYQKRDFEEMYDEILVLSGIVECIQELIWGGRIEL